MLIDDLYLGGANVATGNLPNTSGVNTGAVTTGLGPLGRVFVYDIVPATLATTNVAASQTPTGGTAVIAISAGAGNTLVTASNGLTAIQMDVPRILRYTSGGADTGITFTASGFDIYGQAMSETVTGVSAATASGAKAFYQVTGIVQSGSVATTIAVGTGDTFGLPFFCAGRTYVQGVQWNNTLAKDTGTLAVGVTTAATKTSGDVRGTYTPSTGASDGTKRLTLTMAISASQVGTSATRSAILGVTQA